MVAIIYVACVCVVVFTLCWNLEVWVALDKASVYVKQKKNELMMLWMLFIWLSSYNEQGKYNIYNILGVSSCVWKH